LDGKLVQLNSMINYEIIVTEIGTNMITKDTSTHISVTHNSGSKRVLILEDTNPENFQGGYRTQAEFFGKECGCASRCDP
jgi:hypothetical protein